MPAPGKGSSEARENGWWRPLHDLSCFYLFLYLFLFFLAKYSELVNIEDAEMLYPLPSGLPLS